MWTIPKGPFISYVIILKYIKVKFGCYHYSKYIQFQQIGSRRYININLKQHKSGEKKKVQGGGQAMMTSFFSEGVGLSLDHRRWRRGEGVKWRFLNDP